MSAPEGTLLRHVIPAALFDALAGGGGGPAAVELFAASQRSKLLLLLRTLIAAPGADRGRYPPARAFDVLAAVQAASPAGARAVDRVLAYPSVAAWAAATARGTASGPAPEPGHLAGAAAAAAVLGRVGTEVAVPVRAGRIVLPSLGVAVVGPPDLDGDAVVRVGAGGAVATAGDLQVAIPTGDLAAGVAGWVGLRRLRAEAGGLTLDVALDDLDPFAFPPGLDDVERTAATEPDRWQRSVGAAWRLLARHHPDAAAEIAGWASALVPVTSAPGRHSSATGRDGYGAVALSQGLDPRLCALFLSHEVQHAKLGALLDLVVLVHDPGGTRWYAPWRDDPRPPAALLQGAYAFLGVAGFWRRQRQVEDGADALHAHTEFARWREQSAVAVRTLRASGTLTPAGRRFVGGMAAALAGLRAEPVPPEAAARAGAAAARHRAAWLRRNTPG